MDQQYNYFSFILRGHNSIVMAMAFNHDASLLASATYDTVRVWDTATGRCIMENQNWASDTSSIESILFLDEGNTLAVGFSDGMIRIIDSGTMAIKRKIDCREYFDESMASYLREMILSADRNLLILRPFQTTQKGLPIIDLGSGRVVCSLACPGEYIRHAIFTNDGGRIATSSNTGKTCVWDALTGDLISTLPLATEEDEDGEVEVRSLVFGQRNDILFVFTGQEGLVEVWDIESGLQLNAVPVSPEGRFVEARAARGGDSIWIHMVERFNKMGGSVLVRYVLNAGECAKTIEFWERQEPPVPEIFHLENTSGILRHEYAISPGGEALANAQKDHGIRLRWLKANDNPRLISPE